MDELQDLANQAIDKLRASLLSLSGGALGSTIIFVKDIVGVHNDCALSLVKIAWVLWLFSIVVTLFSFFCQYQALLFQMKGEEEGVKYTATRSWTRSMSYSYLAGALAFVGGVIIVAGAVLVSM